MSDLILRNPADVVKHLIRIQFDASNVQKGGNNCTAIIKRRDHIPTINFGEKPRLVFIRPHNLTHDYSRADRFYDFSNDNFNVGIDIEVKGKGDVASSVQFVTDAWKEVRDNLEANRKISTSQDSNLDSTVKSTYDILYLRGFDDLSRQEHGIYHFIQNVELKIRSRALA